MLEAREAAGAYRAVSLDRPRDDDDEGGDGIGVAFGIEDRGFGEAEDSATVERLMRVLNEREREVLRLRFAEDLTQAEIGERVGVSQMHVVADHPPGDRAGCARRPRQSVGVRSAPWSTGTCARSKSSRTSRRSCTPRAARRGRS